MFSDQYQAAWDRLAEFANSPTKPLEFLRSYNAEDFAPVLWADGFGAGGELDSEVRSRAAEVKRRFYDNRVFAVVPVYVSSVCAEQCVYCNYRAGNKGVGVERKRLSDDELRREALFLIEKKGFRTLELVYASDPRMTADVIARHVEMVKALLETHGGGIVGLSCEAMDEAEYERLAEAGLSFSVLWMETYNLRRYRELHPGVLRKSRFEYRLDAYERMIAAGIPAVGIGILSGLADWRRDWAMLMQHEQYLRENSTIASRNSSTRHGGATILGMPRLKHAPGALMHGSDFIPTTQEFVTALALHNLFAPTTTPFVSTREDWDTCIELAQGGGCLFTLNCSTIPGGYSLHSHGAQFKNNSFDAPVFGPKLRELGLNPVFRWDVDDLIADEACTAANRG
jgi:2-iminoacetate synthase